MTTCASSKQSNAIEKKKLRQYSGAAAIASCVKIELHPLQEALALWLGGEEEPHEPQVAHRLVHGHLRLLVCHCQKRAIRGMDVR